MIRDETMHERARELAAEAVDVELAPADAAWLDEHLAACDECRAVAADYESIHAELRGLDQPEPPRDLWARTQAALDAVDAGASRGRRPSPRTSRVSLLASSLAVVAVVALAGASLLTQSPLSRPIPTGGTSGPIALGSPAASIGNDGNGSTSPLRVVNGTTYWISGSNGLWEIRGSNTTCDAAGNSCTISNDGGQTLGTIASETNVSAAIGPNAQVAAVWNTDKVAIVPLTNATTPVSLDLMTPRPATTATPTHAATPRATVSSPPSTAPSAVVTTTPAATTSAGSAAPSATAHASATPTMTASDAPATPVASATPTTTPPSPATPSPVATTSDTSGGAVAILVGYEIVGRDPEFSADGSTVAFSARPSDHSAGSDVFIWRTGDKEAHAITTTHSDLFAGWFGTRLLISEIASGKGTAASGDVVGAMSFVYDPATDTRLRIARSMLMPSVDPTGTYVVYWTGKVEFDPTTGMWQPGSGDLLFDRWQNIKLVAPDAPFETPTPAPTAAQPTLAPTATPSAVVTETPAGASESPVPSATDSSASVEPSPTAAPSATPTLAPTAVPTATPTPNTLPQRLPAAQGPGGVKTWQVRWDATGEHVATWIADKGSSKVGRLSLYAVNTTKDRVNMDEPLLNAERVMATIQFDASHLVYTSAVDGNTYVQEVPARKPSSVSTGAPAPASAPVNTDRPGN